MGDEERLATLRRIADLRRQLLAREDRSEESEGLREIREEGHAIVFGQAVAALERDGPVSAVELMEARMVVDELPAGLVERLERLEAEQVAESEDDA